MSFKTEYPDFATIEQHIARARIERSVMIASLLSEGVVKTINGVKSLFAKAQEAFDRAETENRAIEADVFVKRWVH
jgi:hypothetical protein